MVPVIVVPLSLNHTSTVYRARPHCVRERNEQCKCLSAVTGLYYLEQIAKQKIAEKNNRGTCDRDRGHQHEVPDENIRIHLFGSPTREAAT